jgi:hypothetical protein
MLGAAFIIIAVMIVRKQQKAASCERHSRTAGRVAIALSVFSSLVGLTLIIVGLVA